MRSFCLAAPIVLLVPATTLAAEGEAEYHPWAHTPKVRTLDVREAAANPEAHITAPVEQPDFWSLDSLAIPEDERTDDVPQARDADDFAAVPDGWVQRGSVVLPQQVADGLVDVSAGPIHAVEDIPGNKYPRKHTLFLNFNGGMLYSGSDNSAEDISNLARQGIYPTYAGGEATALSIVQAVENDVAQYGIRVIYDFRPRKLVPYTMEMIGGSWQDVNIDSPAGGVAPGADCGALGQRHVVYTFTQGGSVVQAANTASQEAGHAWGLDHTFNCDSVMSYCGSGDGGFQNECNGLCEAQCQGPNSAGCRLTHEMFCGEGNDQQNDHLEMQWIFGGNEPDMEAPTVDIVAPETDEVEVELGGSVNVRAIVDDNYGGFGWKFIVTKDGETIHDEPDYDRDVDEEFRAALNLVGLEEGVYTVTVEAEDQFEHITSDMVTIYVGGATGEDGGESGNDSGDSMGGTDSADSGVLDEGGDEDDAEDDDEGGSDGIPENNLVDNAGCGCSAGPDEAPVGLVALFGLLWARRRRA